MTRTREATPWLSVVMPTYNGATYDVLKKTYDPDGRFPGLYEKTVERA